MSTLSAHQQSLTDTGSDTRPPMLKRGSYIQWASQFRRYLNRKRKTRKFLNHLIDVGLYELKMIQPDTNQDPRRKTEDDLTSDTLRQYEADIEAMNLIFISIPNDIYNSVDSCQTAKEMETQFNNEFDQFTAKPGESLVSVYNFFSQLMNDLKRNKIEPTTVTINTKFLNCLQPEWIKYVTNVCLEKDLTKEPYEELFDYLWQYEKLVIASRAKKLEKTHDPLVLVAHTSSSSQSPSPYYVTHPPFVVDYDDEYQGETFQNDHGDPLTSAMMLLARAITQHYSTPTNNRLCSSSNTRNQVVVQANRVNIQSRNVGNDGKIARRSDTIQEESTKGSNVQKETGNDSKYFMEQMLLAKKDEAGVILSNENNDFLIVVRSTIVDEDNVENIKLEYAIMLWYKEKGDQRQESKENPSFVTGLDAGGNWTGVDMLCVEAQVVAIIKSQLLVEEKDRFMMKIDLDDKTDDEMPKDKAGLGEETHESMPETVVNEPTVVSQPKVWSNAPIIEEYESDSEDEHVSLPTKEQETPSFAFINTTSPTKKKHVDKNTNVIAPGIFKVNNAHKQEMYTQKAKSVLTSTGLKDATSVRRPSSGGSSSKNSVLLNTKNHSKDVEVSVIQIIMWIVDSGCSMHINGNLKLLKTFVKKFMGIVRFGNNHFAAITDYDNYVHGNITICRVYYVEGLGHNLFSVGQFCDGDLEVAFRSKTCYVCILEGDDILTGARDLILYTIFISDMAASSPVCLMSKATSKKSWLWQRRLSHLNFGTINHLTKQDLFDGLPKFKYDKDHLCSSCERGKSKTKDEAPDMIKKFIA
ncbi:integrase, catalytic region, zinc finger, CCHC-type containing protein [Tanacetum coccineum]